VDIYQENGYQNRDDYLKCISEDYDLDYEMVCELAELLGESEDFDGLINMLEDAEGMSF
jgi:hypothetical protein